jgi:hypothetical protein
MLILLSVTILAGCTKDSNADVLKFKSTSYFTEELYKNLSITVVKTGALPCNVSYSTINGTALAGVDYTATSGTLEFQPSETQKSITIPITADGWYSSPKYFSVRLTGPDGAVVSGPDTATVTINSSRIVGLYNWSSDIGDGTIVDQSGLGNNGKNNRTTQGNDNGALYRHFDGNHYSVTIPSGDSLNITSGTFEAVIMTSKSSNFNTFLCKRYYGKQGGYWFGTDIAGYAYNYFQNDTGHITAFVTNDTNAPDSFVSDGKKHFVAASYNTTQYVLMVDGKVVFADYGRHDPIGLTSCTLQLSDAVNTAGHGMTGNIYWEKIANGAETIAQMQQDYQEEAWRIGANTPARTSFDITVDPSVPGKAIPSDFLGLSYESPMIAQGYFVPDNTVLLNMLGNLGDGVLRFGGNTGEGTYWSRTGETFASATPRAVAVITPEDIDSLFSFASAAGWKIILGLNFAHYDPAMSADEAAYASEASARNGDPLLAFAIGNEPGYYSSMNPNFRILERPANYTYADYRKEYDGYRSAILAQVPGAPLAGPEGVGYWPAGNKYHLNWYTDFLNDEADGMSLATIHYYAISPILSDSTTATEESTIETSVAAANEHNISLRFDETGTTAYDSNFTSALWSADYLFRLAENGAVGANFHGTLENITRPDSYSPISVYKGRYKANPIYYGMLLFHYAGQGHIIPATGGSDMLSTYATLGDDGKVRVVLINKDASQNVTAGITAGRQYQSATAMRLAGKSLNSGDGVTFAGSQVSADGTWSPQTVETVKYANGRYELAVPAGSAVVVTLG